MESAQQVGRLSVCNAPNMSFLEMTNHCEKQTKMSTMMSMNQRQNNGDTNNQSVYTYMHAYIYTYRFDMWLTYFFNILFSKLAMV